jgi:two-component system response regulator FixJ
MRSCAYASADDFLAETQPQTIECMLLDIRMPGTDGLELFQILARKHLPYPIIFITGHGDIPLAVSMIKRGAFDFLTKPFQEGELLKKVTAAIDHYHSSRKHLLELQELQERVDSCTPREQDVMRLLASGLANKAIAEKLSISPRTVEIHRAHLMEKMTADSLPALVRMVTTLEPEKNRG